MTATSPLPDDARCPCLSGETYGACCGRYHRGLLAGGADSVTAPTAEALMRSRYAAFAVGDADYLLATWHPSTRPADLDLDDDVTWRRLDVVATSAGGPGLVHRAKPGHPRVIAQGLGAWGLGPCVGAGRRP